jgi:CheY-like chemotaxis protein
MGEAAVLMNEASPAGVRILAVDDDPTSRMLTRVTLEDHLGRVVEAENGLVAVKTLERQDFDLAIVDLDMPVMDGFGVIERARARPETRHLPIIVVTGRDDVVAIERAFALGATSFLCKPINWSVFRHQVRYVLEVAHREREARVSRERAERLAAFQQRAVAALAKEIGAAVARMNSLSGDGSSSALPQVFAIGERLDASLARLKRATDVVTGADLLRQEAVPAEQIAHAAIENVAKTMGEQAAGRIDLQAAAASVLCDRELAIEALQEVLANALLFSPAGAKIRLSAVDAAHGRVRFEIEDQGPGMPERVIENGLEAFGSGEGSEAGGLGVGLIKVKAILESHGGHLGVMSEPGRGTEVFLSFPAAVGIQHGEGGLNETAQMQQKKLPEAAAISAS